jgi:hypothetical protein
VPGILEVAQNAGAGISEQDLVDTIGIDVGNLQHGGAVRDHWEQNRSMRSAGGADSVKDRSLARARVVTKEHVIEFVAVEVEEIAHFGYGLTGEHRWTIRRSERT